MVMALMVPGCESPCGGRNGDFFALLSFEVDGSVDLSTDAAVTEYELWGGAPVYLSQWSTGATLDAVALRLELETIEGEE